MEPTSDEIGAALTQVDGYSRHHHAYRLRPDGVIEFCPKGTDAWESLLCTWNDLDDYLRRKAQR